MELSDLLIQRSDLLYDGVVASEIRSTTIWIMRSDSSLLVINRQDQTKFSRYQFKGDEPTLAKMIVDDQGERCVIIWKRHPILRFSLSRPEFRPFKLPKGILPSVGCWINLWDTPPAVLIGSTRGEILLMFPDSDTAANFLYMPPEAQEILEIQGYSGDFHVIVVYFDDKITIFSGRDSLPVLFSDLKNSNVLHLGSLDRPIEKRVLLYSGYDIAALLSVGVLVCKCTEPTRGNVIINQRIAEVETHGAKAFALCQWGIFISFDQEVLFFSNSKTKTSIPIAGVKKIATNNESIAFITENEFIDVSMSSFQVSLAKLAVDQDDLEFALEVAKDPELRRTVLQRRAHQASSSEGAEFLYSIQWPFEDVIDAIGGESIITLQYLKLVFKNSTNQKKRQYLSKWLLHLYCIYQDEFEEELINFVDDLGAELDYTYTLKLFKQNDFWHGVKFLAEKYGDLPAMTDYLVRSGKSDIDLDFIFNSSHEILLESLMRLPPELKVKSSEFLLERRPAEASSIIWILTLSHHIAAQYIDDWTLDKAEQVLFIYSLCATKDEERLIGFLSSHSSLLWLIYRFSSVFGCEKVSTECLLSAGRVDEAVQKALNISIDYATEVVKRISSRQDSILGWKLILKHISGDERLKKIHVLIHENTLNFEDVYDLVDDEASFSEFADEFLGSVSNAQTEAKTIEKAHIYRPRFSGEVDQHQKCEICSQTLIGTRFYVYTCHHFIHYDCTVDKEAKSCPTCDLSSLGLVI